MTDVLKTLEKLPPICAARAPCDDRPILIKRGEIGYYPVMSEQFDVEGFNARHGVSEAQREAMLVGSMFGWDVPGADPDKY